VIVSQWSVADQSTAVLMESFYERLKADDNPNKAFALREAQLAMLKTKTTRHPFFWAPFVLVGDWRK
jgi:CHAT domain-containing protein